MKKSYLIFAIVLIFTSLNNNKELIGQCIDDTCICVYYSALENDSILWTGTKTGLVKTNLTNGIVEHFNTENSGLPVNRVYTIYIDSLGNKWIGTYGGGLVKYDGENWEIFNTSNSGIPSDKVYAINIDKNNNVWIGGYEGIGVYDGSSWTVYNSDNSPLPHNLIFSISFEYDTIAWIGTFLGLARLEGTNWTIYNSSNSGLPHSTVYSVSTYYIYKYVGTSGGFVRFDDNNWEFISSSQVLKSFYDEDLNILWLATKDGLKMREYQEWTTYNTGNTIMTNDYIQSFEINKSDNSIFLSTWGGGSYKFEYFNNIWSEMETCPDVTPFIDENNKEIITGNLIKVYPIPFNTEFNIDISKLQFFGNIEIKLINNLGIKIESFNINSEEQNQFKLRLSQKLNNGVYFLRFRFNNKIYFKKILISN